MKKSFLLFLTLLCLSGASLVGLTVWVNRGAEAVEVTGETLLGTPEEAAGLEVTARADMRLQLGWETAFSPSVPEQSRTRFSFSALVPDAWQSARERGPEVRVEAKALVGSMATVSSDHLDLKDEDTILGSFAVRPVLEMAKTMEPEETRTQTVCLSDYYDAVPLTAHFMGVWDLGDSESKKQFEEFFYIPMPQGVSVTYTVTKGSTNGVVNVEMTSEQELTVTSCSARGEQGWFLLLNGSVRLSPDAPAQPLDLSQVKGGYGLYYIPSKVSKEMEGWAGELDLSQTETVFLFSEGERGMGVYVDDQDQVLLFTAVGEDWYLTVLDPEGRQMRQKVELGRLGSEHAVVGMQSKDTYLTTVLGDGQVCLLSRGAQGYALEAVCALNPNMLEALDEGTYPFDAAWDGERLAMLVMENHATPTAYLLSVWRGEECTFQGRYTTSMMRDNALISDTLQLIQPPEQDPIALRFTG